MDQDLHAQYLEAVRTILRIGQERADIERRSVAQLTDAERASGPVLDRVREMCHVRQVAQDEWLRDVREALGMIGQEHLLGEECNSATVLVVPRSGVAPRLEALTHECTTVQRIIAEDIVRYQEVAEWMHYAGIGALLFVGTLLFAIIAGLAHH